MAKKKPTKKKKFVMEEAPEEDSFDLAKGAGIEKVVDKSKKGEAMTEDDVSFEIDTNVKIAVNAQKEWNEVARDDIDFCLGKQWTDEDKASLNEQRRPCLTFNKIKP